MSANQSEAGSYRHMPRVYPRVSHLLSNLIVLEIIPNINVRTSDVAVMARWHCPGIAPRTLTTLAWAPPGATRIFKIKNDPLSYE